MIVVRAEAGKSSLMQRYVENSFPERYTATIGVDFAIMQLAREGKRIKLLVVGTLILILQPTLDSCCLNAVKWDQAGRQQYRIGVPLWRSAEVAIAVFDVMSLTSFIGL